MSLVELGERLRAERLKRNLSVDEIASHLKMAPRVIRDLEDGNESALPPVYVRGFLKSYSQYLNIDPDALTSAIESMEAALPENASAEAAPVAPPREPRRSSGLWLKLLVGLCILGGVAFGVYSTQMAPGTTVAGLVEQIRAWAHPDAPTATQLPPTAARLPNMAEGSEQASASSSVEPSGQAQTPIQNGGGLSEAAPVQPATPSGVADTEPVVVDIAPATPATEEPAAAVLLSDEALLAASGTEEESPTHVEGFIAPRQTMPETGNRKGTLHREGLALSQGEGNVLVFTGLAECWVHVTVDETDTRQFAVQPGHVFSMSFAHSLVLKLGNAGGVRLVYNGKELPAPGKDGQLATLTFPAAAQ